MRSLHILFILVVVTWLGFPLRAQEAISIGTRHTLFSHVLNEAREYWVYVRFVEIPKILETPWLCAEGETKKTIPPYKEEIAQLLAK